MSVNRIVISGNMVHDPEVKATTGERQTSVCRFRIGVNEFTGGQENTFFLTCVAFGRQAENLERYIRKGNQVIVDGRLSIREYERKEGGRAYATEVLADRVEFVRQPKGGTKAAPKEEPKQTEMPRGFDSVDDGFLPF